MVHDICPHDVFESTGDSSSLVVGSNVHLAKNNTQSWGWNNGVVHFACIVVDEVGEPSLEILTTVEVEHAGKEAAVVHICSVNAVCVGPKVVPLSAYILAETKPRVESVHFPDPIQRIHSLWSVLLDSLPEKLGQILILRHEPIVPSVVVHETVGLCSFVADLLRRLYHCATLVRSEGVVENDSQSTEEPLAPRGPVRGDELVAELREHRWRALLCVGVIGENTHAGENSVIPKKKLQNFYSVGRGAGHVAQDNDVTYRCTYK